jgi:hypothetical protein
MTTSLARRRNLGARRIETDSATLRRRLRWACDPLLRSTIGQALPDRQAELLLNWGLRQMAHSVRGTAGQGEAQARSTIRSDLNLVRKIMRRIQYLLEHRAMLDEADVVAQLAVVTALARQLPEGRVRPGTLWRRSPAPSMTRMARQATTMDAQRWLARLIRFADAARGSSQD